MTLACKKCGLRTATKPRTSAPAMIDAAMRQKTRVRTCKCGGEAKSVEVWSEDLAELRRKAYLYELSEAQPA